MDTRKMLFLAAMVFIVSSSSAQAASLPSQLMTKSANDLNNGIQKLIDGKVMNPAPLRTPLLAALSKDWAGFRFSCADAKHAGDPAKLMFADTGYNPTFCPRTGKGAAARSLGLDADTTPFDQLRESVMDDVFASFRATTNGALPEKYNNGESAQTWETPQLIRLSRTLVTFTWNCTDKNQPLDPKSLKVRSKSNWQIVSCSGQTGPDN